MYKESSDTFSVVEGDTANLIVITLTDRGVPVDLTDCKVLVVFVRGGVPAQQDTDGNGVTISGEHHNIITVDLYSTSYINGNNTAEVVVLSGDDYKRQSTSAWFNFKARRARINNSTILAVPQWPLLSSMLAALTNIARGVQAKWSTTNTTDPSYIQDKPVIGTDLQAATQQLTAATEAIADTAKIPVHDTTHKSITWAQVKSWLGLVFAPITHKSRHASGGADAIAAADILAAKRSSGFSNYTLAAASWNNPTAGLYTITTANLPILSGVIDAGTPVEFQAAVGITAAQMIALQAATLVENSTSGAGTLVLKALGTVPTIDIPIRINVRGDVY